MKHLDLFSGIGGFALATEMVWDNVEHVFCDNDPFSQAILKKHWPNAPIYGDIRQLTTNTNNRISLAEEEVRTRRTTAINRNRTTADANSERQLQSERSEQAFRQWVGDGVDFLTGGFPCQPFSSAGRRAGTEDDRHLWPEMLRVIRETNPEYILGENVGGLLTWDGGLVLEMVLADLESAGYEAGAFVIPAAALNAPHRRDRVWIAAHAIGSDAGGASELVRGAKESERLSERDEVGKLGEPSTIRNAADSKISNARQSEISDTRRERKIASQDGFGLRDESSRPDTNDANSQHAGLERREHEEAEGHGGQLDRSGSDQRRQWREDWPEVAARLCTLDDGLPNGLARPRGWRNAALKGAGNAIVPQVAAEIMRAMKISL